MAISYYVGIPRSGKSYKAVYTIYNEFIKEDNISNNSKFDFLNLKSNENKKEKTYLNCYTNINKFRFDLSNDIYKFNFDEFYEKLIQIYDLYINDNNDDVLIEKAKELNIFKTLFVLDEAHNYLKSKDDKVLVWWLTYHAHLYHDIILITQDLTLISNEYKRVAEYFYRAIPSRLRINKNFKYVQYSSYNMYQKDKIGTETIKLDPKLFELYVSGSYTPTKSIFRKYFYLFFAFTTLLIFSIYRFMNNLSTPTAPTNESLNSEPITQQLPLNQILPNDNKDTIIQTDNIYQTSTLYKFACYNSLCYVNDNLNLEIPYIFIHRILMTLESNQYLKTFKKNRQIIYVLDDKNNFNFITKPHETNKTDLNSPLNLIN